MRAPRVVLWLAVGSVAATFAAACGSSSSDSTRSGDGGSDQVDNGSGNTTDPNDPKTKDGSAGNDPDGAPKDGAAGDDASDDDASEAGPDGAPDGGNCAANAEVCDGVVDDNCNGTVDEGCGRCPLLQTACPTGCCAVDRWQVDTEASDNGSSIAVDNAGNVYFAYTTPNAGTWASTLAVYDAVPGTWRKVPLGSGTLRNRVVVDALGHVHVLYGTYSGNYSVLYVRSDDQAHTFTAPVTVGTLAIGGVFDMVVDSKNQPHVAYGGTRTGSSFPNLTYAHWDGTTWQREVLDTTTTSPDQPDLKLGFMDRPHIVVEAYHPDGAQTTAKRHVFYNGNRWIYENVDALSSGPTSYATPAFSGHSLRLLADGSADLMFTRHTQTGNELLLSHRGPGDNDPWTTATITGASNFDVPTLFVDDKGKRLAVSNGITLHREGVAPAWTSKAVGVPGTVVAQARRGHYLYLGYSDPSNGKRPTVTFLDLDK
ncbi:hypothetical protein [Labilithrix luteola]|uniref:hypothetical protein n=1 Tax=Labilithrix luteola TaxID=1391654 RepID=UPI0011BACBB8|nr:hypothetical protein [Labilithrix luteola]